MIDLLKILLSLSLSGTLLVLVLFLCKPLYKNRFSRQWQYYIWLIVVARLLLPFTPETSLMGTVFHHIDNTVIQTDNTQQQGQGIPVLPETDIANQGNTPDQRSGIGDGEHLEPDKPVEQKVLDIAAQNIVAICLLVWLFVAVVLFIRKVTIYQSFVKYIEAGRTEISDFALWEQVGKLVEQTGIKKTVGLYTNSLISSPLLIGFFRPCIMLPTAELSESDLQNTILHELTHYKRRDMFYKWLVQITVCLHWFNPLVYLMGREINRACELSCDEAVIKSLDAGGRRAYGDTLLNSLSMGGSYKSSVASVTLNENAELLKERLDAIMRFKKTTRFTAAISIALVLVFCFGATAAGAYSVDNGENSQSVQTKAYTTEEADKKGILIMEMSGTWGETMEEILPYMSNAGIDKAVEIYNQKHSTGKKVASDYYNMSVPSQLNPAKTPDVIKPESTATLKWKTTYYKNFEFILPDNWPSYKNNENDAFIILAEDDEAIGGFTLYKKGYTGGLVTNSMEDLYNNFTNYEECKETSYSNIKIGSYDAMLINTISSLEGEENGKVLRYLLIDLPDNTIFVGMATYYESEKDIYEDAVTKIWESFEVTE